MLSIISKKNNHSIDLVYNSNSDDKSKKYKKGLYLMSEIDLFIIVIYLTLNFFCMLFENYYKNCYVNITQYLNTNKLNEHVFNQIYYTLDHLKIIVNDFFSKYTRIISGLSVIMLNVLGILINAVIFKIIIFNKLSHSISNSNIERNNDISSISINNSDSSYKDVQLLVRILDYNFENIYLYCFLVNVFYFIFRLIDFISFYYLRNSLSEVDFINENNFSLSVYLSSLCDGVIMVSNQI